MELCYDIFHGDKAVGKAWVKEQGLYLHFRCRCRLAGDGIWKVTAAVGDRQESLGVLVPSGEEFTLDTKLPVKRLGKGKPSFRIVPRHEPMDERFVPLCPQEPFAYIARLKEAYLDIRNGQTGIVLRD